MAGKIIKIAGKNMVQVAQGNLSIYAKDIINTAGRQIIQNAGQGIYFGKEPDAPPAVIINIEDYWADHKGKPIKTAKFSQTVQIHVQISNIPDQKALVKVFDHNIVMIDTPLTPFLEINIKNGKGSRDIYLDPSWKKHLGELEGHELELYCIYRFEKPNSFSYYIVERKDKPQLLVGLPPKVEGELKMLSASPNHPLPQLYDSQSGEPYYIVVVKGATYANKLNTMHKSMSGAKDLSRLEEKAYNLAIRRLEKGELYYNDYNRGTTRRFYQRSLTDIDARYKDKKIVMGVNKGNFQPGVTTRGINQLEAMVQKRPDTGFMVKTARISSMAGSLFDVAGMIVQASDKQTPSVPFMPCFVTIEVDKRLEEIYEDFHDEFLQKLEQAKKTGNMVTVANIVNKEAKEIKKGYEFITLRAETLEKIISGKITKRYEINSEFPRVEDADCGILLQRLEVKDQYERRVSTYFIHAIYLPKNFLE